MKKTFKKYRNLIGLLLVIMLAVALVNIGVRGPVCFALVACWQLVQFARSRAPGYCFNTGLTPEQINEFTHILGGMKIKDSKLRERTGVTILAIRKEGDSSFNANPPPDTEITRDDVVIVIGTPEQLSRMEAEQARGK